MIVAPARESVIAVLAGAMGADWHTPGPEIQNLEYGTNRGSTSSCPPFVYWGSALSRFLLLSDRVPVRLSAQSRSQESWHQRPNNWAPNKTQPTPISHDCRIKTVPSAP